MAFGKKMQDVFKLFIADIKSLGNKFDFFEESKALDKYLKDAGLTTKAPQFIAELFDELEFPKSSWQPDKASMLEFMRVLPDRIKKEKMSNDILVKFIPKDNWGEFKADWKSSAKSSYRSTLSSLPVILDDGGSANVTISVFLGDITDRIGITKADLQGDNYNYVYSAVEDNLGYRAILAKLQSKLPKAKIRVLDYPNAACLTDARYIFEIKSDPAFLLPVISAKVAILNTLKEIGVVV